MASEFPAAKRLIRRQLMLLICSLLVLKSCNEDRNEVLVRIRNTSDSNFTEMLVASGVPILDGIFFGEVAAASYSGYKTFPKAYGIAYVRLIAGGQERQLIPIDYVGERPLKPGRYTYEIGLSGSGPNDVTFAFRRD